MVAVRVVSGEGFVVRLGANILLFPADARHDVDVDGLCEGLGHLNGTAFTGAVAAATPDGLVGVIAPGDHGWAVLVPTAMRIRTVYRERESSNEGPLHVVKTDPIQLWLWPAGDVDPPRAEDLTVLEGTEGRGAGVVVVVEGEPVARDLDGTVVSGVECACGVLLRPTTLTCWVCGKVVPLTATSAVSVRPTLGSLVVDNGQAHPLVTDYVIGRDPGQTSWVDQRRRPLTLHDHSHTVSRAHVLVSLDGWDILVRDTSVGGTFVRPPDGWRWHRLPPDETRRVLPGSDIRLGRRIVHVAPPDTAVAPHDRRPAY